MRNEETEFIADFCESHKGFYNDNDPIDSLLNIDYSDFFTLTDNNAPPYENAESLLCGYCHIFALALKNILGYNPYIIKGINDKNFHAFCQIYKGFKWYYVDARGITSSFNEFMDVAQKFVSDEYIIKLASSCDIEEWKTDSVNDKEAYAFAEAIINKHMDYYTLE